MSLLKASSMAVMAGLPWAGSSWVHRDLGKAVLLKHRSHVTHGVKKDSLPRLSIRLRRLHGYFIYFQMFASLPAVYLCPLTPGYHGSRTIQLPSAHREQVRSLVPFLPSHFTSVSFTAAEVAQDCSQGTHAVHPFRSPSPSLVLWTWIPSSEIQCRYPPCYSISPWVPPISRAARSQWFCFS